MIQIDMDMPDNCEVCPIKAWEEEGYVCPFSGIPALNIGRQSDCPLREPERKKGKWIKLPAGNYKCSECGDWWGNDDNEMIKNFKFCPNCGSYNGGDTE